MALTIRYGVFAIIAIAVNLFTQELSLLVYGGSFSTLLAVITGTGSGLVCKYILDKRYIFSYVSTSARQNMGRFSLYSLTGLFTTAVFWGFEFGFDYFIGGKVARYSGAIIGLTLGYLLKYQLDKRFVFPSSTTKDAS